MTFSKWAFIYLGAGEEDPQTDRAVIETGGLTTTIVAVPERSDAASVARELVDDGAQSIELCGAFGSSTVAEVIDATSGRVPVGSVTYGPEAIAGLAELFAPTA